MQESTLEVDKQKIISWDLHDTKKIFHHRNVKKYIYILKELYIFNA